uniref:L1 transposable element RRM domain-containing protein n=1 Tax=Xiphophorus maculatus TaxID=8083 RepID=A0A3B5QEY1_XIPMA
MSGSNKRKTRGIQQESAKETVVLSKEVSEGSKLAADKAMDAMGANILAELKEVQTNLKKQITDQSGLITKEMSEFRKEMGKRLDDIDADLKDVKNKVEEAEQRITEVEEFNMDVKDVLSHTLQLQEDLQTRLTDLEARSRRNNIRIYGVTEGEEGDNLQKFIENFIKTELSLTDTTLGIQRCHRSLGPKPPSGSNPRSIVIHFLEYTMKELVVRSAWGKKVIQLKGKRVFFDQDFPSDILAKRKEYNPIRKILKEKGLRFQTMYPSRLRVFYQNGTVIYNSAQDASDDMRKRNMFEAAGKPTEDASQPMPGAFSRGGVGGTQRWTRETRVKHIQEKLRAFKRNDNTL